MTRCPAVDLMDTVLPSSPCALLWELEAPDAGHMQITSSVHTNVCIPANILFLR